MGWNLLLHWNFGFQVSLALKIEFDFFLNFPESLVPSTFSSYNRGMSLKKQGRSYETYFTLY